MFKKKNILHKNKQITEPIAKHYQDEQNQTSNNNNNNN